VNAIRQAAIQLLAQRGLTGFTAARVAERAGVSIGSYYQYFPNKESLLADLLQEYAGGLAGRMEQTLAAGVAELEAGVTPQDSIRRVARELVEAKRERARLSMALRAVLPGLKTPAAVRRMFANTRAALERYVTRLLPRASAADVQRCSAVLFAAAEGVLTYAVDEAPEALTDPAFAECLAGLLAGAIQQWEA
jgi:AcrR family transcriptional regulator